MAQEIINNLLNSTISLEDVLNWLQSENENSNWKQLDDLCTQGEFALYFLNFLKSQLTSLPQATANGKPSSKTESLTKTKSDHEKDKRRNTVNNSTRQSMSSNVSTHNNSHSYAGSPVLNNANQSNSMVKTSTPILNKNASLSNILHISEEKNVDSSQEIVKQGNKSFDLSCKKFNDSINKSLEIVGTHKQNSFTNVLKETVNTNVSDFSSSENLNSRSYRSKNSITSLSENCLSPTSPLLNQSSLMVTPKNQQKFINNSSSTSGKRNISNGKRNIPTRHTPRQNCSLADFIVIDSKNTKKSAEKRNNDGIRNQKPKECSERSSDSFLVTDEMFPEIDSNPRRKRRIKPTKLETNDNKGIDEEKPFGTITRPQTMNPMFVEALPHDKLKDNITFAEERELLKLERQKTPKKVEEKDQSIEIKTLIKTSSKIIPASSLIVPSMELVTDMEILDKLIKLYCAFWDCNVIINPMTELYFIIYLITLQYFKKSSNTIEKMQNPHVAKTVIKSSDDVILKDSSESFVENLNEENATNINTSLSEQLEDLSFKSLKEDLGCADLIDNNSSSEDKESDVKVKLNEKEVDRRSKEMTDCNEKLNLKKSLIVNKSNYFDTPHNCVYFACCVLENQKEMLTFLDRATLKLLAENNRIASFKPDLCQYLNEKYNIKLNETHKMKQAYNAKLDESNICFQMDTDNADNFSSELAFRTFQKQRDMFYEIFQKWEEMHLKPNLKQNEYEKWVSQVQAMLLVHSDITNYQHFARLFKSQLLSSCLNNDQQEEPIDDENMNLLKTLKHLNIEKFTQLQERLVKPLTSNGPVPTPKFHGKEEFFRDLIVAANNHVFYHHLQNCLVYEIIELDSTQFVNNEIENEQEIIVDDNMKQLFVKNISRLRLLAKLLGFLISLPYQSRTPISEINIASQIALRSHIMPPVNIQDYLRNSMRQGRLSITLPWIVEYLAILDETSLRLPYYLQILEFLYYVYRASENVHFKNNANLMSRQTAVLVKFSLGWLFELPNFPKQFYYSWQLNYSRQKLKIVCHFVEEEASLVTTQTLKKSNMVLDQLNVIDDTALYLCCPFLSELKILLLTGNSNINNASSTRHITPISSELKVENDSQQLQMQLEEAFFNGQPSSTRKVVEFVSERVASSCIKHISYNILPEQKEILLTELRDLSKTTDLSKYEDFVSTLKSIDKDDENVNNYKLHGKPEALAISYLQKTKLTCQKVIPDMCMNRVTKCMEGLLPEDTLKQVKDTCISIAVRLAMERTKNWMSTHLADIEVFKRDIYAELNRILKNLNMKNTCLHHDSEAASPTMVINLLRDYILNLLDNQGKSLTSEIVTKLLNQARESLTKRMDLLPLCERTVLSLSVDFALCLLTYRPDLATSDVQNLFIDFWKDANSRIEDNELPLSRILAPRNILLLETSRDTKTWKDLATFIKKILKNDLLTIDCFSEQCVAIFRDEWNVVTLQNLSKFLTDVISDMKTAKQQEDVEKIRTLLEWVAGAYNDIEFFD